MRHRTPFLGAGLASATLALMCLGTETGSASVGQRALEDAFGFSFGEPGAMEFAMDVAPVADGTVVGGFVSPQATEEDPEPPYVGMVARFTESGQQVWQDRFSSGGSLLLQDVTADATSVVASGTLESAGTLTGEPVKGQYDAFVRWYDLDGTLVRQVQFGVDSGDEGTGLGQDSAEAVDLAGGSLYVGGYTHGSLDAPNAGDVDAIVRKYDADGTLQWARQLGTAETDGVSEIKVVGDRVHVAGFTSGALGADASEADEDGDAFVAALAADTGETVWIRQLGTSDYDGVESFDADSRHLYVGGVTNGVLPGATASGGQRDGWVASLDPTGDLEWARQLDTPAEVRGLAVAWPGVVATGFTYGEVVEGGTGGLFVRAYDASGVPVWTRQFGGGTIEGAAAAPNGVYFTGYGIGGLFGDGEDMVDSFVGRFTLHQPDSMAARAGRSLVGSNRYAPRQLSTATGSVARGSVTRFRFLTQNDGEVPSAFRITGCADRPGVRVRYFRGTREITTAVRNGWRTPVLQVGQVQSISVRVRASTAARLGPRTCQLTSRSAGQTIGADRVALSFPVVRAR